MESFEEKISPLSFGAGTSDGIRYIDVIDNKNVLITMSNGFCCYDIRNPIEPTFSYNHCSVDPIKAIFRYFSNNLLNNLKFQFL